MRKGGQLLEALAPGAGPKLVAHEPANPTTPAPGSDDERADLGEAGAERRKLGTSDDATSHGRDEEAIRVIGELGQRPRQQVAFGGMPGHEPVNGRGVFGRRAAHERRLGPAPSG